MGKDCLYLFVGDVKVLGDFLDGGIAGQVREDGLYRQPRVTEGPGPRQPAGVASTPGRSPQSSFFPAVFSSVDMFVTSCRVVVFILVSTRKAWRPIMNWDPAWWEM